MIHMNSKAQVSIITAILIVVIALGLTSAALTWGLPLIRKRQDEALVKRIGSHFDQDNPSSLPRKIEFIAEVGRGEETFSLDKGGLWILNETGNWIQFMFFSRATNIAAGDWVSLTTPKPKAGCPPPSGDLGIDKASVICAKAELVGDGYNIYYRVWYRPLNESEGRSFKISLIATGVTSSTTKKVGISFGETIQENNNITTKIEITI